ncbi:ornithine-acyl[acyl carrier protein] N-acyltransferase [Shimia isoporae]|uniref:L-ornithine N(alpha)-acyltransferase n=2 Tax=Shimia isoporae TaxID=647720 RepID=A0A4V6NFT1_9RHOB|nr:ornithine-acyl[acyl carrier protein] N-acyltransferase [Shimia isoporae]
MLMLKKGRYSARLAQNADDVLAAQKLRCLAFRGEDGQASLDADAYDRLCQHILVEDKSTGKLVCCFRFMRLSGGFEIDRAYSAQFYELDALRSFEGQMIEVGRFCIHPDWTDPDILRVAWGALTVYVDENNIEMLFGCSSFAGTDEALYLDAFAMLRDRHIAPSRWQPKVKAPDVFRFASRLRKKPNLKLAQLRMPPLLRTYLMMGGWVSDHAVVDKQMNTLHVFTGLEIKAIPPGRKRLLRAISA